MEQAKNLLDSDNFLIDGVAHPIENPITTELTDRLRSQLRRQRESSQGNGAPDYHKRLSALGGLLKALVEHREEFVRATSEDFGGRAREETLALELVPLAEQIRHARRHLARWMKSHFVSPGLSYFPARAKVVYQPLGVMGIIGAWNYPTFLTLSPLVDGLAAGNHAMLKPSELAPRTAELIKALIAKIFPEDYVTTVTGGPDVAVAFSALPFDHLIFTGSTRVGKLIMRAASNNLTPVTLELGGKSPTIIHQEYDLRRAAERIVTGKLYNAGQTCLAPDYLLLPEGHREAFLRLFEEIVNKLYPRLAANPDYTRIIDRTHYHRLAGYVSDARQKGATIHQINPANEVGDEDNRVFLPTIIFDVDESMAVMQEEIFGPILPVIMYRTLEDAIAYVNGHPRPLALYYFDENSGRINKVIERTISGGVTINDVIFHILQHNLPFGGVGPSGMGHYHGFAGFEAFSKKKGVFLQSRLSALAMLRPPYGPRTERLIRFLLRS
jgi:coniferyl-aldehyde dehydrogenase